MEFSSLGICCSAPEFGFDQRAGDGVATGRDAGLQREPAARAGRRVRFDEGAGRSYVPIGIEADNLAPERQLRLFPIALIHPPHN